MSFLVGIQLARGLGVAGYGLYGSAMAAASLGATVAAGGLQVHATREIAATRARGEYETSAQLVGWSYRTLFGIGSVAALAVGGYVIWGQNAEPLFALSASVLTLLMAILWLSGAIVRGTGAVVLGQAMNVAIRPTVQSVLLFLSMLALGTIDPVLALTFASVAVLAALPWGWAPVAKIWRVQLATPLSVGVRNAWRRASATIGITTVIRSADAATPMIAIGALASLEQAGIFRVAAAVMIVPMFGTTMISGMVPQMASRLYATKEMSKLRLLVSISCLVMVLPSLIFTPLFWLYGEVTLAFVFGPGYAESWAPLMILLFSAIVISCGGMGNSILNIAGREAQVTIASLIGLSVTFLLCAVLIPPYGAIGAAFSTLIGSFARIFYQIIASKILVGIEPSIVSSAVVILQRVR